MVVPPVVSALTLYFLLTGLSRFSDLIGYDTWLGIALAHVVMIVPFAVVLILVALGRSIAASILPRGALGLPLHSAPSGSSCPTSDLESLPRPLLSFVLSWEEIGVTLFVSSVNAITLPRVMWMGLRDNIDPGHRSDLGIADLDDGIDPPHPKCHTTRISREGGRSASGELKITSSCGRHPICFGVRHLLRRRTRSMARAGL